MDQAQAEPEQPAGETEQTLPSWRPLFPVATRQRDMLTILTAIARFLRNEGFWPKSRELTNSLRKHNQTDHGAVVCTLHFLRDNHYITHAGIRAGSATWLLLPKAWELLGLAPIEPWRRRPSKMLIRRTVTATAKRIMRQEQAARDRSA